MNIDSKGDDSSLPSWLTGPLKLLERSQIELANRTTISTYYDILHRLYTVLWAEGTTHAGLFSGDPEQSLAEAQMDMTTKVTGPFDSIRKGGVIADVGCGTGGPAIALAENGFNVVATNISESQLEIGKALAEKKNVGERIIFTQHDIHDHLIPENYIVSGFDGVLAFEMLFHTDTEVALSNIFESLKPGGVFAGTNIGVESDDERRFLERSFFAKDFKSPEEFKLLLERVGFEDIQIEIVTDSVQPTMPKTAEALNDPVKVQKLKEAYGDIVADTLLGVFKRLWPLVEKAYPASTYYVFSAKRPAA